MVGGRGTGRSRTLVLLDESVDGPTPAALLRRPVPTLPDSPGPSAGWPASRPAQWQHLEGRRSREDPRALQVAIGTGDRVPARVPRVPTILHVPRGGAGDPR
jgi:hypothetical protein